MISCRSCFAALTFLVLPIVSTSPLTAERAHMPPMIEWDTNITKYQFDSQKYVGQRLTLLCPELAPGTETNPVYGTDVYPSAAPLCPAARHAGVISTEGGIITVQLNPGIDEYFASERNGVTSEDLPATERSIVFVSEETAEFANEVREPYLPRLDWHTRFTHTGIANRELVGQRFRFVCQPAPASMPARRVVGTDTYAFASPLCPAAVHAGAVTLNGGAIEVEMRPAETNLPGSIRNGVKSKGGSSGIRSIVFISTPEA